MRLTVLFAFFALFFAFGDCVGPSDLSLFGSYKLDMSVTP